MTHFETGGGNRLEHAFEPRPIRRGTALKAADTARPEPYAGYTQPDGSAMRHGRMPASVPAGVWRAVWQAALNPQYPTVDVLQAGDRIVVSSDLQWELLDNQGTSLQRRRKVEGAILLDETGSLLVVNSDGYLAVHATDSGDVRFVCPMILGTRYARLSIGRRGRRVFTTAQQRDLDADFGAPQRCLVDLLDLGDPITPNARNEVIPRSGSRVLMFEDGTLLTASIGNRVLMAAKNQIFETDCEGEFQAIFTDKFDPVGLSLDEVGRIYLTVRNGQGTALWVLTSDGELLFESSVAIPADSLVRNPIVGYRHETYLLAKQQIAAIDSSGQLRWARTTEGHVRGGMALLNDSLLVSVGSEIQLYDRTGERRVIYRGTETFTTPPVLTAGGRILVASDRQLTCLERNVEA